MRVDVVGRQFEVTEAIRTYTHTKVEKLSKYFSGLQAITVTIGKANGAQSTEYVADLVLDVVGHDDFVSHAQAKDAYAAVDLVAEKGERHLRDFKEKIKNKHG